MPNTEWSMVHEKVKNSAPEIGWKWTLPLFERIAALEAQVERLRALDELIDQHLKCDVKMEGPVYFIQDCQNFGRKYALLVAIRGMVPAAQDADDYVAWLCFERNDYDNTGATLQLCDSDAEGAFKVYRRGMVPVGEQVEYDLVAARLRTLNKLHKDAMHDWETWGIAEISVRNLNVFSYMQHWEKRATEAEAKLAAIPAGETFTPEQIKKVVTAYLLDEHGWNVGDAIFAGSDVLTHLSPPKPKTPAERVQVQGDAQWSRVFLDGVKVFSFEEGVTLDTDKETHANRYAAGLVAELEGKQ